MLRLADVVGASILALASIAAAQSPAAPAQDAPDAGPNAPEWAPHRTVKVLYAGKEDGHRERAFAEFLGRWFDRADTIPLDDLSMATAANHDDGWFSGGTPTPRPEPMPIWKVLIGWK